MKLKSIYLIVFASVALCSAKGTEKEEMHENENKQPITANTSVPQAKPDRLRRLAGKERKTFESGSYGAPSTGTKDTFQVHTGDKK